MTKDRYWIRCTLHWCCLCMLVLQALHVRAANAEEPQDAIPTQDFEKHEGFFDFYWDDAQGKIWLQVSKYDQPFLYVSSLATGLGSNPVGLDRGQLGTDRVVTFQRVGPRLFLIQKNLKYRATTDNPLEQRAIRESFADAVLWSGDIKNDSDGNPLVDITEFLLRDAHDCIGTLANSGQGSFSLDKARSYLYLPRTKAFPENTEFEAALTFTTQKPGRLASRVAADGKAVTLRQHHSFVKLPDDGFRPRKWDPRVGCFSIGYADYGVAIDQPIEQRLITRHRLQKLDPEAELSEVKEPIVYYVDPGAPQPVRDALIEGASWWNEAFEAAGFKDAFQVRVLPAEVDPMDVRYNVIQWVHRATRGWSYGQSVTDPRTGEIIKGHVLLGSLRVRQDNLLFENFLDGASSANASASRACTCGMGHVPSEAYLTQLDPALSSTEVALSRIRQLSAHEVGHTLGFAHNFAASTYADRASVMDYPAPRTKVANGKLDLSDAYGIGIGAWDKFTVAYAYSEFESDEEEAEQLAALIKQTLQDKFLYVTDADARPAGAAHPLGNLWDNGEEPVSALRHEMQVRRIALENFSQDVLSEGQPLAELEKALVPVYLHHRYQVDATAKMLGGYQYSYAVKGDGQAPLTPISANRQRAALQALLETIDPVELTLPTRILSMLPPRVATSASDRERFDSQTSPIFDPTSAVRAAAELTLGNLLQPQRASRLAGTSTAEDGLSFAELCRSSEDFLGIGKATTAGESAAEQEARRILQRVYVDKIINLADDSRASQDVHAIAIHRLQNIADSCNRLQAVAGEATQDSIDYAHWSLLSRKIRRFLQQPYPQAQKPDAAELPPGSPIGLPGHAKP